MACNYFFVDAFGGTSCLVSTSKEAFLYHLPELKGSFVARVSSYAFTAPLTQFNFDSLFLHALTETGLETYSSRSLYHALKDTEGFEVYSNVIKLANFLSILQECFVRLSCMSVCLFSS